MVAAPALAISPENGKSVLYFGQGTPIRRQRHRDS
jgi:hypothetical protein